MPNVLFIKFNIDRDELLFPHEQRSEARSALDAHAHGCATCTRQRMYVFETDITRDVVRIGCEKGRLLAEAMVTERANWKSWNP